MGEEKPRSYEELLANADLFDRSGEHVRLQLTDLTGNYLSKVNPTLRAFELWRMIKEAVSDFDELQKIADRGVPGGDRATIDIDLREASAHYDDKELVISGQQVMQAWEQPLMAQLARYAARSHGDVLEVGFGMGLSATAIVNEGVRSYTVIESNPEVQAKARAWRTKFPDTDIRIVPGRWQDAIGALGRFDGILFDTYPVDEQEMVEYYVHSTYYIEHFLPHAVEHLVEGGVLAYYTSEINSLGRGHQRLLFQHFRSLEMSVVDGMAPPPDCAYYFASSMVAVAAVR